MSERTREREGKGGRKEGHREGGGKRKGAARGDAEQRGNGERTGHFGRDLSATRHVAGKGGEAGKGAGKDEQKGGEKGTERAGTERGKGGGKGGNFAGTGRWYAVSSQEQGKWSATTSGAFQPASSFCGAVQRAWLRLGSSSVNLAPFAERFSQPGSFCGAVQPAWLLLRRFFSESGTV